MLWLDTDGPKLLELAKTLKFSSQGEMFSAANLAVLGFEYFQLTSTIKPNFTPRDIFSHLSTGGLCLVAYDKDKNNTPCLAGGAKAHWAIVAGMVVPLKDGRGVDGRFVRLDLEREVFLRHLHPAEAGGFEPTEEEFAGAFVIALHGNSRHQALWSMQSLLERFDPYPTFLPGTYFFSFLFSFLFSS